jgi:hypothetical protein
MKKKEIELIIEEEKKDPIGRLRNELNSEIISREKFHRFYSQLKNLPEFFSIAKQRTTYDGN